MLNAKCKKETKLDANKKIEMNYILLIGLSLIVAVMIVIFIRDESVTNKKCLRNIELKPMFSDFSIDDRVEYDNNNNYVYAIVRTRSIDEIVEGNSLPKIDTSYYSFELIDTLAEPDFFIDDKRCMVLYSHRYSSGDFVEKLDVDKIYLLAFKDKTVSSYEVLGGVSEVENYDTTKSFEEQSSEVNNTINELRLLIEEFIKNPIYLK